MAVGGSYIDLEWDAAIDNIGVTRYGIQMSLDGSTWNTEINVGNKLYYRYTGLTELTEYHFRVRAYDAASNVSSWSNTVIYPTTSNSTFTNEYQAVLDRATALGYTKPSLAVQEAQNQLILDFIDSGFWDTRDLFYMFAHDGSEEFGRINWVNPALYQITPEGATSWSALNGYLANGSSGLDTNFQVKNDYATSKAKFDNGCFSVYTKTAVMQDGSAIFGVNLGGYTSYTKGAYVSHHFTWCYQGHFSQNVTNIGQSWIGCYHSYYSAAEGQSVRINGASAVAGELAFDYDVDMDTAHLAAMGVCYNGGQTISAFPTGGNYLHFSYGSVFTNDVNTELDFYFTTIGALMSSSVVDQYLIDASNSVTYSSGDVIDLSGEGMQRTSASDAAVQILINNGVTVITK